MRLDVTPQPTPEELEAIEQALADPAPVGPAAGGWSRAVFEPEAPEDQLSPGRGPSL